MSMFTDLMWDSAGRDLEGEQRELARTAAMADAEATVWPMLALAKTELELGHRMALSEEALQRVAERRGVGVEELQEVLERRWRLLAEARALAAPQVPIAVEAAAEPEVDPEAELALANAVARMAATAAAENPHLPMEACLKLAEAAAARHVTAAFPLSYESWGHVVNGPIMDRIKSWKPSGVPKWLQRGGESAAPAAPSAPAAPAQTLPSQSEVGHVQAPDLSEATNRVDQAAQHSINTPLPGDHERERQYGFHQMRTDRAQRGISDHRSDAGLDQASVNDDHASDMEARLDRLQQSMQHGQAGPAPAPSHRQAPQQHIQDSLF